MDVLSDLASRPLPDVLASRPLPGVPGQERKNWPLPPPPGQSKTAGTQNKTAGTQSKTAGTPSMYILYYEFVL